MTGLRLLVGLLLITAPLTAVASKQCTDTFYFTHQADLSAALEQRGIPHELDEDGDYELSIDGNVTYLIISKQSLRLYGAWTGSDVGLEEMNQWNLEYRFSRAYIDEDGDPVLESDLDFEGGVCFSTITTFIETYEGSLEVFVDLISN